MATRTNSHQLILLAVALALVAGLFLLPKVIVKPKEGKGDLAQNAARTANRDNGAAAPSTAELDEHGHPAGSHDESGPTPEQPHMVIAPAQRREINGLLAKYSAEKDPIAKLRVASDLAIKYKAVEKFDSAGYYLEQLAQARPGEQAWKRAADAYFEAFSFAATQERQKQLGAKCQELYGKVLKNNPENLDAKTNLGMAFMASENPVQGVVLLREVLAIDPQNEKAIYNLGLLSMQSNQYEKAVERFRELTKVNPENVNGQFYLGVALAQTGAKEDARKAFQKAKSLSTDPGLTASVDEQLQKLN
ncbi:tetratricopeptide repeat protein [Microvirga sp. STR05]|uniref:Tetratricopeptide repeat protein n=1 Tax=Hymenobacter duratus TaxID=2771356 RepID=A0ABR8JET6_9BACT|nr:tetratricopeptide repeat protein [Hymenobacter duratus]MBD2713905.1 tetratricopeptide repeat protein [Hymenobacter duratus]MBR7948807.1 tetratricopeptide repeat protein [Microvirga sp. STR05]